jgi:hypothetical protein
MCDAEDGSNVGGESEVEREGKVGTGLLGARQMVTCSFGTDM